MTALGQWQTFYLNLSERLLSSANQPFNRGSLKNRNFNVSSRREQRRL
jgi:hypothetical protein